MEQQRTISGSSQSPRSPSSSQPFLSVSVTDPVKLGNGVQSYISYRVITKVLSIIPAVFELTEVVGVFRELNFDRIVSFEELRSRYSGISGFCVIDSAEEWGLVWEGVFRQISLNIKHLRRLLSDVTVTLSGYVIAFLRSTKAFSFPSSREKCCSGTLKCCCHLKFYLGFLLVVIAEKFRFSAEFIEMRRQALDVFVNRIASHRELHQSEDLRLFLQAEEETMERLRSQETGIFKKKPADLMQIFKDVQSKVSDVVLGKEKPVEETDPEYEKMKHYVFELENHLAEAQKHAYRLVKRHRELGQSLSDFGKAVKLLGASEGNALGKAFSELGMKSEILSVKLQKEAHQLLMNFEEPLKDYVRAVQSIKATIAERANAFRRQCELAETMKLKEINLYTPDFAMQLKAESEQATNTFETIVKLMNEEMERFQEQKTLDIGIAFHEFAKGQARLANGIADAWRSLLPKLEACSSLVEN
ncbi:hypothetical protein ACSQ67_014738 [Phaseolus vulgaris]